MRKNKMMRLASSLLVAVLITTSTISGTFSKYTTQDKASDAARVAKWGVELQVAGDMYGLNYKNATDNTKTETTTGEKIIHFVWVPVKNIFTKPITKKLTTKNGNPPKDILFKKLDIIEAITTPIFVIFSIRTQKNQWV